MPVYDLLLLRQISNDYEIGGAFTEEMINNLKTDIELQHKMKKGLTNYVITKINQC